MFRSSAEDAIFLIKMSVVYSAFSALICQMELLDSPTFLLSLQYFPSLVEKERRKKDFIN